MDHYKIAICVPTLDLVPVSFMQSLIWLMTNSLYNLKLICLKGQPVDIARNNLVKMALKANSNYILFIDSDMVFSPDSLSKLMRHNKEVISAWCCQKKPPFPPAIRIKENNVFKIPLNLNKYRNEEGLLKVDGVGTAFLLVKASVFKKLCSWFKTTELGGGEDLYFSKQLNKIGIPIYVDDSIKVGHYGAIADYEISKLFGDKYRDKSKYKSCGQEYSWPNIFIE